MVVKMINFFSLEAARINRQNGFSLVELMIAIVIGLLLVAGATSVWVSSKTSYGIQNDLAETQEAGRFAISWFQSEFREAGFLGCAGSNDDSILTSRITNTEVPSTLKDISNLIEGREKGGSDWQATNTNWLPSAQSELDDVITALDGSDEIASGTDAFTIRGLDFDGYGVTTATALSATTLTLEESPGFLANQIVAIVNCAGGTIFQVAETTANATVAINSSDALSRSFEAEYLDGDGDSLSPRQFPTNVYRFQAYRYYIRPYHATNNINGPSLWRVSLTSAGPINEEVLPGVDNMQLLYGENTGGTSLPDVYRTAANVSDWDAVTSIKVGLLIRSTDSNGTDLSPTSYIVLDETIAVANDKIRRKVFVTEIKLRNRM